MDRITRVLHTLSITPVWILVKENISCPEELKQIKVSMSIYLRKWSFFLFPSFKIYQRILSFIYTHLLNDNRELKQRLF